MKKLIMLFAHILFLTGCSNGDDSVPQPESPLPNITSFSPEFGIPGESILINGTNFGTSTNGLTVRFNGTSAQITNVTETSLNVIVPESQTGRISITKENRSTTSDSEFKVLIDLDKVITDFLSENPFIPGLSMAMMKDGEVQYTHASGFMDQALTKTTSTNTVFKVASVSKLMVAIAIMQQVELGLLDLDEDISTYLGFSVRNPNFPDAVLSTRMFLKHQSSMSNPVLGETVDDIFFGFEPEDVISLHPLIEDVLTPTSTIYNPTVWMNVEPGGALTKNSNLGITLLGYLVEVLSGQHWNDYTTEHIFEPLGMTDSSFYYPDLDPNNISDIFRRNDGTVFLPFVLYLYPAECLYTSSIDWLKFTSAILNGGELNGTRILQQSSIDSMLEMETPLNNALAYDSNIGLVWREVALNPGWVGHTGGGLGTHVTELNLENNISYIMMTNKPGIDGFIGPGGTLNTIVHQWLQEQIQYR